MEKVAIIGLSCLFPDAQSPEQFWQNLIGEKNSVSLATEEQIGVDPDVFYDPVKGKTGETGKYYCKKGGYVKDFQFDPTGYRIAPEILESLDYIYKWSLYVSRQALVDSGYWGRSPVLENCGVILGNLSAPTRSSYRLAAPIYQRLVNAGLQELFNQRQFRLTPLPSPESMSILNVLTAGYPSAVVAQALALSGINFSLDAACASSLYAIKLACQYLLSRKADMMLAGAVSCTDPFMTHTAFSLFQAYPTDGSVSRPLDRTSAGLMTGEGAGMLVLKRYGDAVRDGDRIYATILGVGLSNDGRGKHFLSPNPKGQMLAFERAYADAGIAPQSIDYVECHGTGTPLGDPTELNSMDSFFGAHAAKPLVGSVKSNIGHLLTAAGMPSLLKVILSMNQGMIPPTINLQEPLSSTNAVISSDQIVQFPTPWVGQAGVKRAAVSSFGFGGTNSHLVLEQGQETPAVLPAGESEESTEPVFKTGRLAIVGMDAFFGEGKSLDAFGRAIYEGLQPFIALPEQRWRGSAEQPQFLKACGLENGQPPPGAYIDEFELDYLHFRIPPDNNDQPIPQQLLILKVADNALRDAGIQAGDRVAVVIAMSTELASHQIRARCDILWQLDESLAQVSISLTPEKRQELEDMLRDSFQDGPVQVNQCISFIGNIMASRISSVWDFTGPSFTVSAEENSVFKALEVAQLLLAEQPLDAVLVGGVELSGGDENVLLRNQIARINTGAQTLSFDQDVNGWIVGEGAGAVVLKRLEDTKQPQDRVYAVIDAISLVQDHAAPKQLDHLPQPAVAAGVVQSCQQAWQAAGITPDQVGYLEVFGSGVAQEDAAEMAGLLQAYQTSRSPLSCAIGSVKATVGHTYAASGIASLIKTALCLYYRYIPATPGWKAPKQMAHWQNSPFYVAAESRPWSLQSQLDKRVAAINGLGMDRTYAHLVLSEDPSQVERPSRYLEQMPFYLFPLSGGDRTALLAQLDALQQTIAEATCLAKAAGQTFAAFQADPQPTYVLAIVGHTCEELNREIERARPGITKAFDQTGEWRTPMGSYFTANPLGKQGGVAFVYPGAFNSYIGLARDTYRLFPRSFDSLMHFSESPYFQKLLHNSNQLIYPRSLQALSLREQAACEAKLLDDPSTMLLSGTLAATVSTHVMQDYFQIKPDLALGYSLGELSMMFALNVWPEAGDMSRNADLSPLFKARLAGPRNAVRDYWGLPPQDTDAGDDLWATHVLIAPAVAVLEAVQQMQRVYVTHINTPNEVVIAGDPTACSQLMQQLSCESFRAPANYVLHCEAMRSEYDELIKWLVLPVAPVAGLRFYSSATYDRIALDSHNLAHTLAKVFCTPVDFPRLVNRAYDDGARVFIELGAGGTCSRWIQETLQQKDHITMPTNTRGVDDHTAIVRTLARLVSHQVAVDLSPLYSQALTHPGKRRSLIKTVTLGGMNIKDAIVTAEHQQSFADYRRPDSVQDVPEPLGQEDGERPFPLSPSAPASSPCAPQPAPRLPNQPLKHVVASTPPAMLKPVVRQKLNETLTLANQTHATFLQSRQASLQQISHLLQLQTLVSQQLLGQELPSLSIQAGSAPASWGVRHTSMPRSREAGGAPPAVFSADDRGASQFRHRPGTPVAPSVILQSSVSPTLAPKPDHLVFDYADVLEFAQGKIANVFGSEYAIIDTYSRRVRLPMPPYLFISRVTKMEAKRGCFEPCSIETEYDIPKQAWYSADGEQVPCAILVEACHGNMILISYLGIDFETRGERIYRALDGESTFVGEMPRTGETMRAEVRITSFVRSGETLLYFFSFDYFVGDRKFLQAKGGAGFFTDAELAKAAGVTLSDREKDERKRIQKQSFTPLLTCQKTAFNEADLLSLSVPDLAACFGAEYDAQGRNRSLGLPLPAVRMFDRVVSVDPRGGAWGLGLIIAEKTLDPEHWYFNCHFKDDYCVPGTLIGEGCSQLLIFYALYLGLQTRVQNGKFHPILGLTQTSRSRGQVTPTHGTLTFQLEIFEIGLEPTPYIKAEASVILNGKVISFMKNIGSQLIEKGD